MKVKSNGITINCVIEGPEGAPWVTMSHALANNLSLWDDLAGALKDRYRVLRFDNRGHGDSEVVPGPYSFPMLLDDAVGLLDAVGVDATHWIGLSIGGMVGYGLGIHFPERIKSIIACDSRPDAPPDYAAYFQSRIDKAKDGGMDNVVESTIERWFTPQTRAAQPPVLDRVRAMIRGTDPVGHAGCCEALKTLAYGPELHKITVPTLLLGGAQDKGAPPEALAEAAAKIAKGEHLVIPNAGHITPLENPDAVRAGVEDFLRRHA